MSQAPPPSPPSFFLGLVRDWGIALGVVLVVFVSFNLLFAPGKPSGAAPDFTLPDLQGQAFTLSELPEEVVVLNFWFTSCPPCRAEIPELAAFHSEHPEIPLIGVSTDIRMPPATLKAKSERLGINYTVVHDSQGQVAQRYGVDTFPTTLVLRGGEIMSAKVGMVNQATLMAMIESAAP